MGPNRKEAAAELILLFQVHDPSPRRWPWGQDSSSSAYRQVTLLSARARRGTGREGKPGRPSAHAGEETARRGASRLLAATGTPAGRGQGPGPARGSGERQGGPESRGAPLSFPPPARPSCRVTPGEHGRGLGARGAGLDLAFRSRARPRPRASRRWRDRAAARGGRSPDFDRGSEVKAPSVLNDHPKPRKRDGVAGFPSRGRGQASSWPLGLAAVRPGSARGNAKPKGSGDSGRARRPQGASSETPGRRRPGLLAPESALRRRRPTLRRWRTGKPGAALAAGSPRTSGDDLSEDLGARPPGVWGASRVSANSCWGRGGDAPGDLRGPRPFPTLALQAAGPRPPPS